jgi:Zn-dependent peptidase ImmA (M78 family)
MGRRSTVPITPSVLTWAIEESAYSPTQVAEKIGVSPDELEAWQHGQRRPNLVNFRKLASVLKRTPATFLLPEAPPPSRLKARFRHPAGAKRTGLNPVEARYLREAARLQDATGWIMEQLGEKIPAIPERSLSDDAEEIARATRQALVGQLRTGPERWRTPAQAFDGWRAALEDWGVLVLLFPMGKESAQGFSLWQERSPVAAVSTAWRDAARLFTLFHEVGHLLTRTNSVCLERVNNRFPKPTDRAERWCERFAAAVLLPWDEVTALLRRRFDWHPGVLVGSLNVPRAIANHFNVSLRAATLRLIERGAASWDLYTQIPALTEDKQTGGGGGGRDRREIREDQYGERVVGLFVKALGRQVVGRSDVLDRLDLTDSGLSKLERATSESK